ncbi:hypothetical protein GJ496_002215 [Pomphorhynchus laevis]|nr:hypothetical protein GJ496_002215 [Pomphorhynchus laevis]
MVALAVTIASKRGQVILSRQFIGMTKSRLESLINIFPRLITKSSSSASIQHTYIETDDVRYLYHPMEHFYLILLTTKSSNIIDDLETLKLFARIFPEYCKSLTEKDVCDAAFDLLFAFDEVISLGYKEDLTPLQIKTFTDMDSHDERVFLAMRQV